MLNISRIASIYKTVINPCTTQSLSVTSELVFTQCRVTRSFLSSTLEVENIRLLAKSTNSQSRRYA